MILLAQEYSKFSINYLYYQRVLVYNPLSDDCYTSLSLSAISDLTNK